MTSTKHPVFSFLAVAILSALPAAPSRAEETGVGKFFESHCADCHDAATKKGNLDLGALKQDFSDPAAFDMWVKVSDKVAAGEMPPKKKKQPPAEEVDHFIAWLDQNLITASEQRRADSGRAAIHRLTRVEYTNALRDLLGVSALKIMEMLPADGTRHGYDKVSEALDLSQVQLAKYMEAADLALDAAIARRPTPPPVFKRRIFPAAGNNFHKMIGTGNGVLLRKTDDGFEPDPIWPVPGQLIGKAYMDTYEASEKAGVPKSLSAVGLFHPNDNYMQTSYMLAPVYSGRYRLRLSVWSFMWNAGTVEPSPHTEVAMLHVGPRTLGYFDAPSLKPQVTEITPWLDEGDEVFYDSASLYLHDKQVRHLPGGGAGYVGPGIATDWMEVEGPIFDQWPPQSHRSLFGDLPIGPFDGTGGIRPPNHPKPAQGAFRCLPAMTDLSPEETNAPLCTVISKQPVEDATRLLGAFLPRAFRRPVPDDEVARYVALVQSRMEAKECFEDAMRYAYKTALASPSFLFHVEKPGKLDDVALASRLSFWLWNSVPDDELLTVARQGQLHAPETITRQVERMLSDPKSDRFVTDFLDQWLKLRDIDSTDPDSQIYPEFHLYLKDSMLAETRAFLRELINNNLSITNVVSSDFLMMNERLAEHYRFIGPRGSKIQKVPIPADSERSGLITQGSVMKVTANGTTTSPVIRGIWLNERILGVPVPPPPSGVPAIDPDTHGATTIREQLEKHRADPKCAACHAKIDPTGFALEAFDVIGGLRAQYRSLGLGLPTKRVFPGGWLPSYKIGPAVECSGKLPDGRGFNDINDLRKILLADPDQITRNFLQQMATYATGAEPSYLDRREINRMVAEAKKVNYGIRGIIHLLAESDLFQRK